MCPANRHPGSPRLLPERGRFCRYVTLFPGKRRFTADHSLAFYHASLQYEEDRRWEKVMRRRGPRLRL